ncbi:kinase-like domain-containing protein [Trametes polyzona]|nr:kinase-like domain-containing protein [Trametes polyzona]
MSFCIGLGLPAGDTPTRGSTIRSKLEDKYTLEMELGKGTFATVFKAINRYTGERVAYKYMKHTPESESEDPTDHRRPGDDSSVLPAPEGIPHTVMAEILALKTLCDRHHGDRNSNILRLIEFDVYEIGAILVLELCPTDLRRYMNECRKQPEGRPLGRNLLQTQRLARDLLRGVAFCHAQRIVHRDLKPENLLLDSHGVLKIGDFGLARQIGYAGMKLSTKVATLWYRAPELLRASELQGIDSKYSTAIDTWSCGCILVEMIIDRPLFQDFKTDKSLGEFFQSRLPILEGLVMNFLAHERPYKGRWGHEALDLLQNLLRREPEVRMSAAKALAHPFLAEQPGAPPDGNMARSRGMSFSTNTLHSHGLPSGERGMICGFGDARYAMRP